MWVQMMDYLKSFFIFPGISVNYLIIGILLGIAFGAIWLCMHWPPLFKESMFWVVLVISAFLTMLAIVFIEYPLQYWFGQGASKWWNQQTLITWFLLVGTPGIIISGVVQEAAKMVPIAVWWWRSGKKISPRLGLAIGAVAGASYGVLEAVAAHNQIFAAGWTLQAIQLNGFTAIAGFWERFFAVGFHIAVSALVGYGLAKGKGWKFYLIAAGLHSLLNYAGVVRQYVYFKHGFDSLVQIEAYVAILTLVVTAWVLILRWVRTDESDAETEIETGAGAETGTATGELPPADVKP
jgi:hypothetical protein